LKNKWTLADVNERTAAHRKFNRNLGQDDDFFQEIMREHLHPLADEDLISFDTAREIASRILDDYHKVNDADCSDLKQALQQLEATPGRVRLAAFYSKRRHLHWKFEEKLSTLRNLGTLDEANPDSLKLIIVNYAMGRQNCLDPSDYLMICCSNGCEDLLGHIEADVGTAFAAVEKIVALVSWLPSATVPAPRNLSENLLQRLNEIAARHRGRVPLHSRLFSQWMHHAYPLECPYPHMQQELNPLTTTDTDEQIEDLNHSNIVKFFERFLFFETSGIANRTTRF